MAELKDSGERRTFDSGAVRDVQEGKGRCDLLPLDVVATFISSSSEEDSVLKYIDSYVQSGNTLDLIEAVNEFCSIECVDRITAVLEVAKHYEDGAIKYKPRNWEKGIPLHCYIDSGVRHYLKHMRGDRDEPHNRAFIWNMFGAIWTHNHKPELIDLPFKDNLKQPVVSTPDSSSEEESSEPQTTRAERMAQRMNKYRETSFA